MGATGGKLLGAGGGGFFLFQADTSIRSKVDEEHKVIPLILDDVGSTIIFDDGARQE